MKKLNNKWFSLVELLVVITILAIISVVAYQNFGWAVDKAVSSRKINDIWTIETALQQFKVDKNYYPMPMAYDENTNKWWYSSSAYAFPSNTISVTWSNNEISAILTASWWWMVFGTWSYSGSQIWAKWVIGYTSDFEKKYLSKELYDPELWDIKVWSNKMIDFWIGRYVYRVYSLPRVPAMWNKTNNSASYYNIATSIKQKDWELYETYIAWDYDENSCYDKKDDCPKTLIWSLSWTTVNEVLLNKTVQDVNKTTLDLNQWIPYPVKDFE